MENEGWGLGKENESTLYWWSGKASEEVTFDLMPE